LLKILTNLFRVDIKKEYDNTEDYFNNYLDNCIGQERKKIMK